MSFLERRWIIQDGKIPPMALKAINETIGKKELILKEFKQSRTLAQNNSIHLYCDWVSEALNECGQDVRKFIKPGIDLMWTPYLVKELLWRPTQKALFGKKSTTQLNKIGEIDDIYDVLNKAISERTGQHIPFPSVENYDD